MLGQWPGACLWDRQRPGAASVRCSGGGAGSSTAPGCRQSNKPSPGPGRWFLSRRLWAYPGHVRRQPAKPRQGPKPALRCVEIEGIGSWRHPAFPVALAAKGGRDIDPRNPRKLLGGSGAGQVELGFADFVGKVDQVVGLAIAVEVARPDQVVGRYGVRTQPQFVEQL